MSVVTTNLSAVVLVGHVCIDRNVIEGVALPPTWGSAVLHADAFLATQQGIARTLIAPHGIDFTERWPTVQFANSSAELLTLVYENTISSGEVTRRCSNSAAAVPTPLDGRQRAALAVADILIHAPLLPNYSLSMVDQLVNATRSDTTRILLGQGYLRDADGSQTVQRLLAPHLDAVLSRFEIVVVSDEDLADDWDGARSIAALWARDHPSLHVVVTRNARGAVLFHRDIEESFSTLPLEAAAGVVGAGDTFGAALAIAHRRSSDIRSAIAAANDAARAFIQGAIQADEADRG